MFDRNASHRTKPSLVQHNTTEHNAAISHSAVPPVPSCGAHEVQGPQRCTQRPTLSSRGSRPLARAWRGRGACMTCPPSARSQVFPPPPVQGSRTCGNNNHVMIFAKKSAHVPSRGAAGGKGRVRIFFAGTALSGRVRMFFRGDGGRRTCADCFSHGRRA
eukprot:gene8201-biopygen22606